MTLVLFNIPHINYSLNRCRPYKALIVLYANENDSYIPIITAHGSTRQLKSVPRAHTIMQTIYFFNFFPIRFTLATDTLAM